MSILQSSIKVKNPLLEFCLLNGYTMCLGYFTQNRYESVDSFLLNAEHVQNFISIYPNILSTLFFAQLDWFKQSSNDSVDEDKSDTTSQCDDSNEQQLQQPIVQLAPTSVINEETNKLLNRDTDGDYSFNKTKLDSNLHLLEQAISQMNPNSINNDNGKSISNEFNKVSDGDFPFIKNKIFSIAGFDFPVMPFDFQIFNSEMNDAVLGAYTYERLNGLFRDVCQLIWKIIKPAYPNNVPEQCLHEICAVFVYKYPIAQSNFDKIRTLNPTMLKPNLVDIGKFLSLKFKSCKISSSFSRKRAGTWVYQKPNSHSKRSRKSNKNQNGGGTELDDGFSNINSRCEMDDSYSNIQTSGGDNDDCCSNMNQADNGDSYTRRMQQNSTDIVKSSILVKEELSDDAL